MLVMFNSRHSVWYLRAPHAMFAEIRSVFRGYFAFCCVMNTIPKFLRFLGPGKSYQNSWHVHVK